MAHIVNSMNCLTISMRIGRNIKLPPDIKKNISSSLEVCVKYSRQIHVGDIKNPDQNQCLKHCKLQQE